MLSSHLCLGLPSGSSLHDFRQKILYAFLIFPRATCPIHLVSLDMITPIKIIQVVKFLIVQSSLAYRNLARDIEQTFHCIYSFCFKYFSTVQGNIISDHAMWLVLHQWVSTCNKFTWREVNPKSNILVCAFKIPVAFSVLQIWFNAYSVRMTVTCVSTSCCWYGGGKFGILWYIMIEDA